MRKKENLGCKNEIFKKNMRKKPSKIWKLKKMSYLCIAFEK